MSGHSKWSTIKHKKAATDAKRGKLFTKLIKELTVAARMGGGDINGNPRLRTAVQTARAASMPNDNIERAIKNGTGELEGVHYEEVTYEGYGAGGVAIIVNVVTDNRNRSVAEIRKLFERRGGNMGASGCVGWMFKKKGVLAIEKGKADEDKIIETALEAGADDVHEHNEYFEIVTAPDHFDNVRDALHAANIETASAEVALVPDTTVGVSGKDAEHVVKLLDELDDHDDVQGVASNADLSTVDADRLSA